MMKVFVILGAAALVILVSVFGCIVSWQNRAVGLENRFKASLQKVRGTHDNIQRIVEAKAGVAKFYRNTLVTAIEAQVQGRKGGDLAKAIHESVPGVGVSVCRDVANAVEAQRVGFLSSQTELLAIKQEHDNLRMRFPSSLAVGSRPELVYNVITSERTERVFSTGWDESDNDPFAK